MGKQSDTKEDELSYFLRLANRCRDEALNELKTPLKFLGEVDSLFMEFIQKAGGIKPATVGILLMNTHASLRAAMGLAFSGQLLPVFMALRGSIESALYANAMVRNPELQEVWLNRDSSENARQTCRDQFTAGKMFLSLTQSQDREFSERLRQADDATLDFGAHPNNRLLLSSTHIETLGTGEQALNFTYLYGVHSFELRQSLVACAETGLAVFFVALICHPTHPRAEPLNIRALELQDQLPNFVTQLELGDGEDPR